MQESSLHAALKDLYAGGDPACQEALIDGYLIDVHRDGVAIEIQTANFSALKDKLADLLQRHPVRLVHPIAQEKWIVKLPAQGAKPLSRRKSPKRGRQEEIFRELVRIPHLALHPGFSLEIVMTREEELRRDDGQGSWRRGGWSIVDHRLLEVVDRIELDSPAAYRAFLPPGLPEAFTSRDLAKQAHLPRYLAQKMLYCLRKLDLVEVAGKHSRSYLYRRT